MNVTVNQRNRQFQMFLVIVDCFILSAILHFVGNGQTGPHYLFLINSNPSQLTRASGIVPSVTKLFFRVSQAFLRHLFSFILYPHSCRSLLPLRLGRCISFFLRLQSVNRVLIVICLLALNEERDVPLDESAKECSCC